MATFDFKRAEDLLNKHKAELGSDANEYFGRFQAAVTPNTLRGTDDYREATKMAVDASKSLLQIGVAVFVALMGLVQFAVRSGHSVTSWPVGCLWVAAFLTFVSMCVGFYATGSIFKRAEGRVGAVNDKIWSTEPIKNQLLAQSLLGVAALAVLAYSAWLWSAPQEGLLITLPEGTMQKAKPQLPLVLQGNWSQLELRQEGEFSLQLGSVPANQTRSLAIQVR